MTYEPSLRFTVSRHNSLSDVQATVENLADVTRNVSEEALRAPSLGNAQGQQAATVT